MIVHLGGSGETPALRAQDDFSALAVQAPAEAETAALAAALGGHAADEPDHVWIPAERLRALAAGADDAWHASFDAMLAKVEPYGWYDAANGHVKAHVERPG